MISDGNLKDLTGMDNKPVTKRLILSIAQRVFDPIAFCCPMSLKPKLLLQQAWRKQIGWDSEVDEEDERVFREEIKELPYMRQVEIPRWLGSEQGDSISLHKFCDVSRYAYPALIF